MKRMLRLSDIACYFPYGLYVTTKYKNVPMFHIAQMQWGNGLCLIECDHDGERLYEAAGSPIPPTNIEVSKVRPILRPLSDLYERIAQNGESFIPIRRLAEIAFPDEACWTVNKREASCVADSGETFYYDEGFYSYESDAGNLFICPQTPLFDLLNEWKIDYRGLIPAGLAVSVNDLKINPYA